MARGRIRTFSANPDEVLLRATAEYVASGALRPAIDTVHPLTEIAVVDAAFPTGGMWRRANGEDLCARWLTRQVFLFFFPSPRAAVSSTSVSSLA